MTEKAWRRRGISGYSSFSSAEGASAGGGASLMARPATFALAFFIRWRRPLGAAERKLQALKPPSTTTPKSGSPVSNRPSRDRAKCREM
jgi:hypothetical protein